ncbi:MAG: 4-hydroxythreonine-4-phosphate dehydrogenase PdxA [Deltaproteobacteria bacterium]|jgi:4-hydroxythreonine-4-phosphate dehydrogenase|nr:4-hydroxythreonine-4-phosphate dehydrogenase PdxA [Deltaproteobacteria bacterium]
MAMNARKNIVITMGDPAGISGEVIVKAFAALARPKRTLAKEVVALAGKRRANLYVAGDGNVLVRSQRIVRDEAPIERVEDFSSAFVPPGRIRLFELGRIPLSELRFGVASYGRDQLRYLDFAIEKARRKAIAAIVTGPVTKEAVAKALPGFVGHTGYLAEQLGVRDERMAFLTPEYLLALQTTHVPLADVARSLTRAGIVTTIAMLAAAGRKYYGRKLPVAVLGVNPHAGEHGLLGLEEDRVILPAMAQARAQGWPCDGPFPADSFFISRVKNYRLIVAMYHDQGLVAVKPAFPRVSVNVTLGLPVVRTSVDHGSGYDIAGQGKADATSMLYAIKASLEMI